jgi:2-polyprenyl-3-methyl-5-hydroxy-6-metoxy-1,4-benzoquinol methylase
MKNKKLKYNLLLIISIWLNIITNLHSSSLPECFEEIYNKDTWNGGSGPGSFIENTVVYRNVLQNLIDEENIRTIVDIGCGDWQIMRHIHIGTDVNYVGYDVASNIISINQQNFSAENISFVSYSGDFSEIVHADLCIVKDVLQHLNKKYIDNFINNMKKYKYVIITNCCDNPDPYYQNNINGEIINGNYRPLDLTLDPYSLEMELLADYEGGGHKKVYLWRNIAIC